MHNDLHHFLKLWEPVPLYDPAPFTNQKMCPPWTFMECTRFRRAEWEEENTNTKKQQKLQLTATCLIEGIPPWWELLLGFLSLKGASWCFTDFHPPHSVFGTKISWETLGCSCALERKEKENLTGLENTMINTCTQKQKFVLILCIYMRVIPLHIEIMEYLRPDYLKKILIHTKFA